MQYKSTIFDNWNYSLIVIIPKRGVYSHMKREKDFVGNLKGTSLHSRYFSKFPWPVKDYEDHIKTHQDKQPKFKLI